MELDLRQNHFELFDLPVDFEVPMESLAARYRDLQRATHPDRFANASDRERRISVQQAARVNEAFQTLKDPLNRARYMLELGGKPLDDSDTQMDPGFLMEQMELREALDEVRSAADPFSALDAVRRDVEGRERALVTELGTRFADGSDAALEEARERVRKLQFMSRLLGEIEEREEDLVHGG